MAQTFTAYFLGIAFAANKNMGALLNNSATEVIKVRRVGLLNSQTAAVTGVLCSIELRIYRGTATLAGSTAVAPVSHDGTNTAAAALTVGHAGTVGGTPLTVRRVFWSSDEASISTGTNDELQALVPLNIIYDWIPSTDVQPITLRNAEMLTVFNTTGATGLLDLFIEYTKE